MTRSGRSLLGLPVGLLVSGLAVAAIVVGRRRHLRWGTTDDERTRPLPGDDLLPDASLTSTRAIAIAAPPAAVWPWLVQIGQGRGGFYSYDALENAVARCDIHSATRVVPEWQALTVGDEVRLHPEVALHVAVVDPGRTLVLTSAEPDRATDRATESAAPAAPPYDFTWAFVLDATADGGSRLIMRERYRYRTGWAGAVAEPVAAVSFVMSQKMLRTLRDRARA